MGKHVFGVGGGYVPCVLAKAVEAVAARHGATFHRGDTPGGERYWFVCDNRVASRAVVDDLESEGLWDAGVVHPPAFTDEREVPGGLVLPEGYGPGRSARTLAEVEDLARDVLAAEASR